MFLVNRARPKVKLRKRSSWELSWLGSLVYFVAIVRHHSCYKLTTLLGEQVCDTNFLSSSKDDCNKRGDEQMRKQRKVRVRIRFTV